MADYGHTPPRRRSMEDELEELILHSNRRRAEMLNREEHHMPARGEALKTILPWVVAVGMFLWNAGGQWTTTAAANQRVEELKAELKASYVTKDAFEHVAEDVREIRQHLLGNGARVSNQQRSENP